MTARGRSLERGPSGRSRTGYVYASSVTVGVSKKFSVGGGDVVVHSRPLAPNGLVPATLPYRSDHIRYTIGIR